MSLYASPGLPWSEIAESAYKAYAAITDNKNYQGHPMPKFIDLPRPIRIAWEAAVRQAASCIDHSKVMDESRWTGWTPPV